MTVFLLSLLNVQLSAIVGWAVLERRSALQYRRDALQLQEGQLDADLATWARLAGRKRPVLTSLRDKHQETGHGDQGEDFTHPSIVQNGTDDA